MAWNASTDFKFDPTDFKFDPNEFNKPNSSSGWGGSFDDAYKTDWNKDFTKNTSSERNFGKEFLDRFKQNLFGGQGDSSSSSSFKGGGAYGANFNPFTADLGIITQGGGPTQYIAGRPSFLEGLGQTAANAAVSAGMGALFG